ncbi:iron-sulfur cluster insertion protein ErpA [Derxia lacustris]|uniref:iron-sulfur cluster insertion protein ErpA n=1 Tax=Derxia lacustris TaxID=764842 RepID=UPI000A177086|nr:iron-sulfur cluster insertion protein ErpA [Derxia lacustris]
MSTDTLEAPVETPQVPVNMSDSAAAKIQELITEEGNPELKLRIYVTGGGCSGFQYGFAFEETMNEDDLRVERNGVSIIVDAMSLQYLAGANIEYEDSLEGSRFVIKNPNATSTCGCGSSFSV